MHLRLTTIQTGKDGGFFPVIVAYSEWWICNHSRSLWRQLLSICRWWNQGCSGEKVWVASSDIQVYAFWYCTFYNPAIYIILTKQNKRRQKNIYIQHKFLVIYHLTCGISYFFQCTWLCVIISKLIINLSDTKWATLLQRLRAFVACSTRLCIARLFSRGNSQNTIQMAMPTVYPLLTLNNRPVLGEMINGWLNEVSSSFKLLSADHALFGSLIMAVKSGSLTSTLVN